jgi:Uma2 family endonuclease
MATPARPSDPLTIQEYLDLEERSEVRHEYVAGEIHAMSGVTRRHNRIATRIFSRLAAAVRSGPCEVLVVDVLFRASDDAFYYPDVMVTCDGGDDAARVVTNACLVVEVTSPSTRMTDRREKLVAYKRCPSVQTYLIVEQNERLVERHWRDAAGAWRHETITSGTVPVPCPPTALSIDEIYESITFDPAEDEPPRPPRRVREAEPA